MSKELEKEGFKWYHRLFASLLWGVCRIMNYSPRWFRFYIFAPFVTCVLRMLRYRRAVIQRNLSNAFPEKSQRQRDEIMRRFYSTLAEIVVDTVCLAGATPKHDSDLILWRNKELHAERTLRRDWIAMASHYGCWEFFPLWSWVDTECHFVTVYHPLKSKTFELFYRRLRKFAPNLHVVPMADAIRHYVRNRREGHGIVLGLVSDQSPNLRADTRWYDFLNQKTAFIDGSERIAMRFNIPIYFLNVDRIAPGRYGVEFVELYDGKESVEEGEITRRYAVALEEMIRRCPELWMWSHKRWKHTPEKQAERFGTPKNDD